MNIRGKQRVNIIADQNSMASLKSRFYHIGEIIEFEKLS